MGRAGTVQRKRHTIIKTWIVAETGPTAARSGRPGHRPLMRQTNRPGGTGSDRKKGADMGAAKEHRDAAAMRKWFDDRCREKQATNINRAQLWADLMRAGHILTFRANNGAIFTAGSYQTATGPTKYAQLWHRHDRAGSRDIISSAWHVALMAIEYCGRGRPIMIDGCKV